MSESSQKKTPSKTLGIVGARGFTGAELIGLLANHPGFELQYVSSRELAGTPLSDHIDRFTGDLRFEELSPEDVAQKGADVCVLALPNKISGDFVAAIERTKPDTIIIDISADHRFDRDWTYGMPERFRDTIRGATRIANPGCYATGIQLGLAPVVELAIAPPMAFGVSGYSGAGATPSPKNDLNILRDNLMPYSLTGHIHEAEASHHLGHRVGFSPHVAPYFRGITLTLSVQLARPHSAAQIRERFDAFYAGEALVEICDAIPLVKDNAGKHFLRIGGIEVDAAGERLALVVTLDNLLKGAATQALQNANLACGFDELAGINLDTDTSEKNT
ncbi:N-acetyl-gamma-glutamyl-phosphate reductase [Bradymonas sediminis]|uniref:N-acetyl-gamma-glutamyl-phosphate reductase n=1 Tax=Bradymonas sediminis TaxID=1548548 RepID=A0A2Z4FQI5_9DELT|nr:N-acetyl-gamma-glutamyl-phosphate reductase [Bradymonas sediminis]AWV90916.1 N-acetyl-gamma-glutamyl-phosphate reductase [Bradymonas sediminis]TDP75347.1 N-acetyl-gamma-glutamyl-phosphate reductase [Bradymonas sediminis]